jgi:hypothetical protein
MVLIMLANLVFILPLLCHTKISLMCWDIDTNFRSTVLRWLLHTNFSTRILRWLTFIFHVLAGCMYYLVWLELHFPLIVIFWLTYLSYLLLVQPVVKIVWTWRPHELQWFRSWQCFIILKVFQRLCGLCLTLIYTYYILFILIRTDSLRTHFWHHVFTMPADCIARMLLALCIPWLQGRNYWWSIWVQKRYYFVLLLTSWGSW